MKRAVIDKADILDRFVSVLFPQRCLFCGEVVRYEDFWCGECGTDGQPPYARSGRICCEFPCGFTDAVAAVEYDGRARELILRLKDRADRRILRFFAGEMLAVIAEHWSGIPFDLIVPVPATALRLKERGFNQAAELARHVSGQTGVPMRSDALIRRDDTRVQHGLTAPERRVNAEKSYGVGNRAGVAGKTILLIDDVFTTGATANACSGRLLKAGAQSVYVAAASRPSSFKPDERNAAEDAAL